jgi:hypothetical protein
MHIYYSNATIPPTHAFGVAIDHQAIVKGNGTMRYPAVELRGKAQDLEKQDAGQQSDHSYDKHKFHPYHPNMVFFSLIILTHETLL